jgi:hypothetical protein
MHLCTQLVYFSKILGTLRFDLKQLIKPTLQELDIESIFLKQAKCTDLIQKKSLLYSMLASLVLCTNLAIVTIRPKVHHYN